MVINQPTTFPNLNLVSDLDPGFLFFFSTPSPPWGLVDTRHGTGIFGLDGFRRWVEGDGFCFFFADEVLMFFFMLGGLFWIFLILFFGDLWELLLLPGVFFPRKTPSVYTFFFWFAICQILFFFSSHFMNSGGTSRVLFGSVNKIEAFFGFKLPACFLFFRQKITFGMDEILRGRIVRDTFFSLPTSTDDGLSLKVVEPAIHLNLS